MAMKICDGCQKEMKKATAKHEDKVFCPTCYKREFKRVSCAGCGKGTYTYHGKEPAYCKSCRIKDLKCSGCEKPLPRAAKIIDDKAYCWPCASKLREPEPCAVCGQLSLRLARAPEIGIDERICQKCRTKKTHFTCTECGKYRKPAGIDSKGQVVCKSCLENENYRCPKCGQPGKKHSKTRCQDCYWKEHAQSVIAEGVAALSRPWTRQAYRAFGESLITSYGAQKASHRIPRYLVFFISLDMRFKNAASITARNLIKTFRAEGLRRNTVAVAYLSKNGIFPAYTQTELEHYNEIARQERLIEGVSNKWYGNFLSNFWDHALHIQQTSLDRKNKGPKSRTVYTWVSAAKAFLEFVSKEGVSATSQIESHHLTLFLQEQSGYEASIRRFIRFLNKNGKMFTPIRMESIVPQSISHLFLPQARLDEMLVRFLSPETSAKEAIFGVLMVVYAQSVSRICDLRMDQLGRNKDGLRTIRFYRIDVEIDKFIEPVIERWLEERKSLTVMESAHDNKYLFPGRRPGDHITTSSVKYYYNQWGVTANQLLASSLFQMYCNGIRHPNVPHDAFGVSKAMTGKYIGIFDAHYHDAISYFQDKEKKVSNA